MKNEFDHRGVLFFTDTLQYMSRAFFILSNAQYLYSQKHIVLQLEEMSK